MKQIFKMPVPFEVLETMVLQRHCVQTDKSYTFDMNAFRKFVFHAEEKAAFLAAILPHYHRSKQFYVTRKLTYNSVVNILRQICKTNGVVFSKKLCYNHSKYTIVYYVHRPGVDGSDVAAAAGGGGAAVDDDDEEEDDDGNEDAKEGSDEV